MQSALRCSICDLHWRAAIRMLNMLLLCAQQRQGGMGVVGVSPRYAERVAHKFSQFWRLPHRAVKARGLSTLASAWSSNLCLGFPALQRAPTA